MYVGAGVLSGCSFACILGRLTHPPTHKSCAHSHTSTPPRAHTIVPTHAPLRTHGLTPWPLVSSRGAALQACCPSRRPTLLPSRAPPSPSAAPSSCATPRGTTRFCMTRSYGRVHSPPSARVRTRVCRVPVPLPMAQGNLCAALRSVHVDELQICRHECAFACTRSDARPVCCPSCWVYVRFDIGIACFVRRDANTRSCVMWYNFIL